MAKENHDTKPKGKAETPFRKFERLAGKIARVPKDQARERSGGKPK